MVLDAILFAMAEKGDIGGKVKQMYKEGLPDNLIPGLEANVTVNVTNTFYNFWSVTLDVQIEEVVQPGFWVNSSEIYPTPYSVNVDDNYTTIVWDLDVEQGMIQTYYKAYTRENVTKKGWALVSRCSVTYYDPIEDKDVKVYRNNLWVQAKMATRLVGDRDIELDGVYPLHAQGDYFDIALVIENKEDTEAKDLYIIDIVPLKSPIVDVDKQTRIPNAVNNTIFFYDNPNYPLPLGVTDYNTTFTVEDADCTYIYNGTGIPMELPAKKLVWDYGTLRVMIIRSLQ